jgi:hypothetical protein
MAADTFQLKRGTTAAVNAYLPAVGEPVYDITLKRFTIGDGVTLGGVAPLNAVTADKLSTARDIALTGTVTGTVAFDGSGNVSMATSVGASLQASFDLKAPLASPAFTGIPTVPTAAVDTNTTQAASTAFVVGQASATNPLVNGTVSIGTSLRYSRQDHVHPIDTSRAPLASPGLTGVPTAPTASPGTSTTQLATTAFVTTADNLKANLASPPLTGTPTAPTAAVLTNTTQLATTAFVQNEVANKRAWTSYTPTITPTSGTFTTISATGKYLLEFGVCHLQVAITVTAIGTGTKPIFTLPFAALTGSQFMPLPASEQATNGKSGVAVITAGLLTAATRDYANGDLATANGSTIFINGSYPIA